MQKIVINGANGFVASHFILGLLQRNYEVIAFVRNGKKQTARQRMLKVLNEINSGNKADYSRLKVYDYSLFDENYSLTKEQIETIFAGEIQFFHFAACLKFSAKDKEKIFETNVEGLKNTVQFFQKYATSDSRFNFISTAYSCGKYSGVFEEKFYPNEDKSHFRNYYEQSKRFAENVVREHIEAGRLKGHVVRLSQVVGNSKTGVTKTDYGIFDLAKRLYKISILHPGNALRIKVDPDSTQNLIPVNVVADALFKMAAESGLPPVIHLTAKNGVKNETIARCLNKYLPLTIITDKKLTKKNMTRLERMMAVGMSFTGKYTQSNLLFDNNNLHKIMPAQVDDVTEASLCRMMAYFFEQLNKERHTHG